MWKKCSPEGALPQAQHSPASPLQTGHGWEGSCNLTRFRSLPGEPSGSSSCQVSLLCLDPWGAQLLATQVLSSGPLNTHPSPWAFQLPSPLTSQRLSLCPPRTREGSSAETPVFPTSVLSCTLSLYLVTQRWGSLLEMWNVRGWLGTLRTKNCSVFRQPVVWLKKPSIIIRR